MRRKTLAEEHPELVPQWGTSNELSPSDVSSGSHKKVWWTCEKGHSWEATIKNRALLGSGCPYCEHGPQRTNGSPQRSPQGQMLTCGGDASKVTNGKRV